MGTPLPPCWTDDDPLAPWNRQPGWQVAVGTRTPRFFRVKQALTHIFKSI